MCRPWAQEQCTTAQVWIKWVRFLADECRHRQLVSVSEGFWCWLVLLKPAVSRLARLKPAVIRLALKTQSKTKQPQILLAFLKPPQANLKQITNPWKVLLYIFYLGNWLKQIIWSSFLKSQHFRFLAQRGNYENHSNMHFDGLCMPLWDWCSVIYHASEDRKVGVQ